MRYYVTLSAQELRLPVREQKRILADKLMAEEARIKRARRRIYENAREELKYLQVNKDTLIAQGYAPDEVERCIQGSKQAMITYKD